VSAAVGDHSGLTARGEKDGEGLAEQYCPLWAVPQILDPCDRLPAAPHRKGNVLAGRNGKRTVVEQLCSSGLLR